MSIVKAFNGEMLDIGDCMGCAIANSDTLNPGPVIKTKNFDISQDFELPINGFIVIGSKRHISSINEMTEEEKIELITLIDIVVKSLKKLNVCSKYSVVWDEKPEMHFHAWLMPKHEYLLDVIGTNPLKKIGELFAHARSNLSTKENLQAVEKTTQELKKELLSNEVIKKLIAE